MGGVVIGVSSLNSGLSGSLWEPPGSYQFGYQIDTITRELPVADEGRDASPPIS